MTIKIVNKILKSLKVTQLSNEKGNSDLALVFTCKSSKSSKSDQLFKIEFSIALDKNDFLELIVVYDFIFESETKLNSKFSSSKIVKVDAPEMAYPYLKAYTENILASSGITSINLPFVDFKEIEFKNTLV